MAHDAVGARVDNAMVFLAGNLARPQPPQIDARPPGKRESRHHHGREHVGAAIADRPDRFLAQHLRRQRDKQDAPGDHGGAVGPGVERADPLLRAAGPERCRHPAAKPGNPDELEYGALTTHDDPDASWTGRTGWTIGAPRQPAKLHWDPLGTASIA